MAEFKSGNQVVVVGTTTKDRTKSAVGSNGPRPGPKTQQIFREMLEDPTIRLAVDLIVAMLKRQPWTVEGEDTDYCNFIWKALEPYREMLIKSALRGHLKDGWRAFEIVYKIEEGQSTIAGIKSLKASLTQPLVYEDTGEFAGVENCSYNSHEITHVVIDEDHVLLVNFDDDTFGELGDPLLKVAMGPHLKWVKCDEGAQRYDAKVAGGFLFIKYPVGSTPFAGNGGADTDNSVIMAALANSFEAAGYGGVPVRIDPDTGAPIDAAWSVEHVAAGGGLQPSFVTREKYLDALKLRAFGIPERTTTEGTFGTKAEAEAHADVAVLVNTDRHGWIIDCINRHIVQKLNIANKGDRDACRLVLGKLDPADRELFSTIFTSLMADPVFGERIAGQVDVTMLLDKLNVPVKIQDDLLTSDEDPLLEVEGSGNPTTPTPSGRSDASPAVPEPAD